MCTVIILRRPGHDWPLLIAANRDEMQNRSWLSPDRHWPERGHVVAGQDELAGGTWLGVNNDGVVSALLNRVNSLGPATGYRSRGELPLDALDHAEAGEAAKAMIHLEPESYKSFNLLIADRSHAFCLSSSGSSSGASSGEDHIMAETIPPGISMITAHGLNTPESSRQRRYKTLFEETMVPDPSSGNWDSWIELLSSKKTRPDDGPEGAMNIETDFGFGTVCSSLIALPAIHCHNKKPIWLFCSGPPDRSNFNVVTL